MKNYIYGVVLIVVFLILIVYFLIKNDYKEETPIGEKIIEVNKDASDLEF